MIKFTKENTAISITAFDDYDSLKQVLDNLKEVNTRGFEIFCYIDFKTAEIQQSLVDLLLSYGVNKDNITTRKQHTMTARNKINSLYDVIDRRKNVDFILSLEDDIILGPQYIDVMEDLMEYTKANIVSSVNFGHLPAGQYYNKFGELISYLWQFFIRRCALERMRPLFMEYYEIQDQFSAAAQDKTRAYLRKVMNEATFHSHRIDFKAEAMATQCNSWDTAIHWFTKIVNGYKYTTILPHCKPIARNGLHYTKEMWEEGDKHLTKIEHNLTLPIKWKLTTEFVKD